MRGKITKEKCDERKKFKKEVVRFKVQGTRRSALNLEP
jgi:hypothetical protein